MSVIYSVIPYTKAFTKPEVLHWLDTSGTEIPANPPYGRNPTPKELRSVVATFDDCYAEYRVTPINWGDYPFITGFEPQQHAVYLQSRDNRLNWQLEMKCGKERISVNVLFSGDEDKSFHLSFTGHWDYILQIVQRLANVCGTFVLLSNGEDPTFVTPQKK